MIVTVARARKIWYYPDKGVDPMSNGYITQQCRSMMTTVSMFESACEMAATRDDGKISSDEEKSMKQIRKATKEFKSVLDKLSRV